MPLTLAQLRDKANARLSAFWPEIVARQDAYFAKHGKYFQKLITNRPVDSEELDFVPNDPSDEKNPADAVLTTAGGKLPFAIQIDEWVSDTGAGWSATVWVELSNGDVYTRSRTHDNVDSGWSKYEPENVITP